MVRPLQVLRVEDEKVTQRTHIFRKVFTTLMTVCLPVAVLASACSDEGGGNTIVDNSLNSLNSLNQAGSRFERRRPHRIETRTCNGKRS